MISFSRVIVLASTAVIKPCVSSASLLFSSCSLEHRVVAAASRLPRTAAFSSAQPTSHKSFLRRWLQRTTGLLVHRCQRVVLPTELAAERYKKLSSKEEMPSALSSCQRSCAHTDAYRSISVCTGIHHRSRSKRPSCTAANSRTHLVCCGSATRSTALAPLHRLHDLHEAGRHLNAVTQVLACALRNSASTRESAPCRQLDRVPGSSLEHDGEHLRHSRPVVSSLNEP
eukprot:scaffold300_cov375-Prasinococcus_capsulatus_cf.AAC.5